jgi:hypothetical protein
MCFEFECKGPFGIRVPLQGSGGVDLGNGPLSTSSVSLSMVNSSLLKLLQYHGRKSLCTTCILLAT